MPSEMEKEGGDEAIVVPIITPTTVALLARFVRWIRGK